MQRYQLKQIQPSSTLHKLDTQLTQGQPHKVAINNISTVLGNGGKSDQTCITYTQIQPMQP